MGTANRIRACIFGIAEIAIVFVLVYHADKSRSEFSQVVPDGLLLTAQLEGFWGPVQVVIPTTCSPPFYALDGGVDKNASAAAGAGNGSEPCDGLDKNESDGSGGNGSKPLQSERQNLRRVSTANRSPAPLDGRESPCGPVHGSRASAGAIHHMESRENETHHIVHLKHCKRTVAVKKITGAQYYFGMVWLGGASSVEELKEGRYWAFVVIAICVLGGARKIYEVCQRNPEDQGNAGPETPRPDDQQYQLLLENNPLADAVATTLCSPCLFLGDVFSKANMLLLFVMSWHGTSGLFVLNYFQGRFFLITLVSTVCFCVLPVWFFVLGIPALGYIPYQSNFMWNIIMAGSLPISDVVVNDTSLTNFMLEERNYIQCAIVWIVAFAGADIVSKIFAHFLDHAIKVSPAY